MVPRDRIDDTFKDGPLCVRLAANRPEEAQPGVGIAGSGLSWNQDYFTEWQSRDTELSTSPNLNQPLAWPRRAPQGKAPLGWGGKRRTPVSWIRLASSLEATRRKGARGRSGVTCPPHPSKPPLVAGPMKTLSCTSSGALYHLLVLNPGGGMSWDWPRRRVLRARGRPSDDAETKAHCPESSTCDAISRDQEKASPVLPPNAGAPSSKLSATDQTTDPIETGQDEGEKTDLDLADSQPQEMLTH